MMAIDINILNRKAAESLHQTIGELILSEVPRLPSPESRLMFWRMVKESAEKNLPEDMKAVAVTTTAANDMEVAEALALFAEMEDMESEIPEPGQDFASDVLEKARSIGSTISRSNSVTGPQRDALENMLAGMQRWIRD